MLTLIFVLVWVGLALGLLFVAFSGGTKGAAAQLMSTSRGARRAATVLFFVAVLVLGAGIPAAVIAAVSNNDSIPEANVTDLTASEQHGRDLFGQRCANCHTLKASNAIAEIGPDLDEIRPNKALVLDALQKGRADGDGQMAANLYTGEDAEDVANYVAKAVGQTQQQAAERRLSRWRRVATELELRLGREAVRPRLHFVALAARASMRATKYCLARAHPRGASQPPFAECRSLQHGWRLPPRRLLPSCRSAEFPNQTGSGGPTSWGESPSGRAGQS